MPLGVKPREHEPVALKPLDISSSLKSSRSLDDLPLELLHDILFLSQCSSLPVASRWLYSVFRTTTTAFRVRYIRSITEDVPGGISTVIAWSHIFPRWLAFGICTLNVVCGLERSVEILPETPAFRSGIQVLSLPKGFMRRLFSKKDCSNALEVLRYIRTPRVLLLPINTPQGPLEIPFRFPMVDMNSGNGYMLCKAVRKGRNDLVKELINMGADSLVDAGLAFRLAIGRKDINLLKRLAGDKVIPQWLGRRFLRAALLAEAMDIVDYLMKTHRVVPDMKSMKLLRTNVPNSIN